MKFIETIENVIGNYVPIQAYPVVSTYADISDFINTFGYKPNIKLFDGIKKFTKWYKIYKKNNPYYQTQSNLNNDIR